MKVGHSFDRSNSHIGTGLWELCKRKFYLVLSRKDSIDDKRERERDSIRVLEALGAYGALMYI